MPGNYTTTKLLLPTLGDQGNTGHAITVKGTPVLKSFNAEGNTAVNNSMFFNGTDTSLSIPSSSDFVFGTGKFTISCWINMTSTQTDTFLVTGNVSGELFFGFNASGDLGIGRAAVAWDHTYTHGMELNVWHHVAVIREDSGLITFYVDGVSIGSASDSRDYSISSTLYVGAQGAYYFEGYLALCEVHKGVALYTTAFTPPKTVAEVTNDVNTKLLLDFINGSDPILPAYPPAHNATYAKATSSFGTSSNYEPYHATDPALPKTGGSGWQQWTSAEPGYNNHKFNVDIGTSKIITKIYLEAAHASGIGTDSGIKDFIVYGTNSPTAFSNVTYATLTDLTELGTFQAAEHVASDVVDPQYFDLSANTLSFRYYVLRIANNWGSGRFMAIRHIEFQSGSGDEMPISQGAVPTVIVDSSVSAHTVTNANASGCTFWWDGAWYCDNTDLEYLTLPYDPDWDFGTGDFTVSIRCIFEDASLNQALLSVYGDDSSRWGVLIDGTGLLYCYMIIGGSNNKLVSWTPVNGVYYDIEVSRTSDNIRFFVNGVQVGATQADSTDLTLTPNPTVMVGNRPLTGVTDRGFNGWLGEIVLTNSAGHVTTFTPPTAKAISDANTKLLISPDGNSAIGGLNHDITFANDGIVLSQEAPTGFDGSYKFDGSTDYITIPDSDDWPDGNSAFTVDLWVYPQDAGTAASCYIFGQAKAADDHDDVFGVYFRDTGHADAGKIFAWGHRIATTGNLLLESAAGVIALNEWQHLAFVFDGVETWVLYLNGVSIASDTYNPSAGMTLNANFTIGNDIRGPAWNNWFKGNIAQLRVSNTAIWSFNFTPPTEPYNTDLLAFYFSNEIPTHSGTVYGTSQPLKVTVTIGGVGSSYLYDTYFYDDSSIQIGSTVSGTSSSNVVTSSSNLITASGSTYSWYVTVTSSGYEDTSSVYSFINKYLAAGTVDEQGVPASGIPIRLYRRSTGEFIGGIESTVSGTFAIETDYNEEHYVIALHPDTATNALIYDHIEP